MCKSNLMRTDCKSEAGLAVFQLSHHIVDVAARALDFLFPEGAMCLPFKRAIDLTASHLLGIDIVAQTQEDGGAQRTVLSPALEIYFGDELWLNPGRRAMQVRFLGEWALFGPQCVQS